MVADRASQPLLHWLALYDAAELMYRAAHRGDPHADARFDIASRVLRRYEHTLTPLQRRQAREWRWLRDAVEPLPPLEVRLGWGDCTCQICQRERQTRVPSAPVSLPFSPAFVPDPALIAEPPSPPPAQLAFTPEGA